MIGLIDWVWLYDRDVEYAGTAADAYLCDDVISYHLPNPAFKLTS